MAVIPLFSITLATAPAQAQQVGRGPPLQAPLADVPRIERFEASGDHRLAPGNELTFTVHGTPGARVELAIEGAKGVLFLPEIKPGEYSGDYTIRRKDRIASNSVVTASMRIQNRVATARLKQPLLVAAPPEPRVVRYCTNCATVEAINVVQVDGDGNYLGERHAKRTQHYEVVIRFSNGGTQSVTYENDPGLRVGETVKLNNGVLERDAG